MGALDGYRVLEFSVAMAGPLAGMHLADLGADVIKIEPPGGEWQRRAPAGGATGRRVNASFLSLNRNKRSLTVDLKHPAGRELLLALARRADVFLQNYRPGVAARLGLDYEAVRSVNPSIVYVSISGYGEDGPYASRPGQDLLLQAMTGGMHNVGSRDQVPMPAGTYTVDAITAYSAAEGTLAALLHRERTGQGQLVTVNMLDAAIAVQAQELSVFTVGGVPQARGKEPHGHVYIRAPYGVFTTADGYVVLAMPPLEPLGRVLGSAVLSAMDEDIDGHTKRDEITAIVRKALVTRTTAEWLDIFEQEGIWAGPIYTYEDLLSDPQVKHNGSFVNYEHPTEGPVTTPGFPYNMTRTPLTVRRGAPLAGQDTREVLKAAGYGASRVQELLEQGVVTLADEGEGT